ncbi:uncharacterized protein [Typha angustifolia]|uniref:uncharacterized protein n=1 Tax=Typha angustifolia TaxID=59011 RepID=UPI003C2B73DA
MSSLRLITTIEMCKHEEFYKPFLGSTEYPSILKFCWKEVVPLGVEADNVQIIALSNALEIPVKIVVIDSSSDNSGEVKLKHYDFIPGSESTAFTVSTPPASVGAENIDTGSSSVPASDSPAGTSEVNVTDIRSIMPDPSQPSLEEEKTKVEPNCQPQAANPGESSGTSKKNISEENTDIGSSSSFSVSASPVGTSEVNVSEISSTTLDPSQPSLEEKKTVTECNTLESNNQPQAGNPAETSGTSRTNSTTCQGTPFVILLYRPGHYDILYRR